MRNLSISYNTYTIVFIFYIFSISSSIAQNKEKAIYQIYEGTQHYEEQLNEIYDILKLGREGKTKEYEETIEAFKNSKGYYSSSTSMSTQYQNDKQRKFKEKNSKSKIKLRYKKGKNSQKEFIWTILDKHKNGTDTLLHIYLNCHLYTTKIKGVKYVLVRKVDYKTLINRTNNAIGYFSFKPRYRFKKEGELETEIESSIALGNNEQILSSNGAFDINITNTESEVFYGNSIELFRYGYTYERIFKPKGKLLQKSKNIKIYLPLDIKKKNASRIYDKFKGSRYYAKDLNEIYDVIKLFPEDFTTYQQAVAEFRDNKGYEDDFPEPAFGYSVSGDVITFDEDLEYGTPNKLMNTQDPAQKNLENLKFPMDNKKEKEFIYTMYEGEPELGDTLMHFFLKYYYVEFNLMGSNYNLVYQIDYDIKVDISQVQDNKNGFYIEPIYDLDESGNLTTEFNNKLWFITKHIKNSINFDIQANSNEVKQPYSRGFWIPEINEKYFYQYIFRPEKEITEVKNNEFYEEEIDDECGIKELFKQLEELYILYEKDSSEVYLKNALELVDSAMINCENLKEFLTYTKLEFLFLLKEYDSLFVEIDSMDVNNFSLPELKDALRVKYKVQMYKEQGEQEKAESLCKETILSLESKLKTLEFPVKKKNTISTIFELKMLFESKEKVTKDLQLYKEKYPQFEELFEEITWTIDYKYE